MLRLIFCVLYLLLYFILSIVLLPFAWLLGKINMHTRDIVSMRIVQWGFSCILWISGVHTTVRGLENIPKDEAVLFIGNHRGIFDILISYKYLRRPTGIVAKKEMKKTPVIPIWMGFIHCLFLDRSSIKEGLKTILQGIDYMKSGISIIIYPEGTRNKGDGILEFHAGSFKLATKSGCKIIPFVQNHTEEIFEKQFPKVRRTKTILEFLPPIDPTALSREELKDLPEIARSRMLTVYERNKSLQM